MNISKLCNIEETKVVVSDSKKESKAEALKRVRDNKKSVLEGLRKKISDAKKDVKKEEKSTKISDSEKRINAIRAKKIKDARLRKLRDELEDTESTEDFKEVAVNALEGLEPSEVLEVTIDVLADLIDQVGGGEENEEPIEEVAEEVTDSKKKEVSDTQYNLNSDYDARKSFYGKAKVNTDDETSLVLYSYDTKVAEIKGGKPIVYGTYSRTTLRHIKEFLKQNGFKAENSKQIMADYGA